MDFPFSLLVFFLAPPLLWLIFSYNSLVNRRNQVRLAFSTIDVQLKKRFDLIPALVETVKGYAAHEKDVLESVTRARSLASSPGTGWQAQENLQHEVGRLIARAESYPDLKASDQFLMLQRQLAEVEAQIAAARRTYNSSIMDYHNAVEMFPSSIVASLFSFTHLPPFEVAVSERDQAHIRF